jgi:hypothetical protein
LDPRRIPGVESCPNQSQNDESSCGNNIRGDKRWAEDLENQPVPIGRQEVSDVHATKNMNYQASGCRVTLRFQVIKENEDQAIQHENTNAEHGRLEAKPIQKRLWHDAKGTTRKFPE